jgi:hypothetical protein
VALSQEEIETQLHDAAINNLSAIAASGNLPVAPHGNLFALLHRYPAGIGWLWNLGRWRWPN